MIAGGSVRLGWHQRELVRFCRERRDELVRLPSAFYSVSVSARRRFGAGQREVAKALSRFIVQTSWTPRELWPIPGALNYTRYTLPIKAMLVLISLMAGGDTDASRDHEYTDWAAVETLGIRFARAHAPISRGRGAETASPVGVAFN